MSLEKGESGDELPEESIKRANRFSCGLKEEAGFQEEKGPRVQYVAGSRLRRIPKLLCLPGGYFAVKSTAHFKKVESDIKRAAKKECIATAVGIDYVLGRRTSKRKTKSRPNWDRLVKTQQMPAFAVLWA